MINFGVFEVEVDSNEFSIHKRIRKLPNGDGQQAVYFLLLEKQCEKKSHKTNYMMSQ